MIDFDSAVVKQYQIPYEPKMFPLYVNNEIVDYENVEDDDEVYGESD